MQRFLSGLNIAATVITESGSAGNYTLTATVGGNGSTVPTGAVTLLDASNGNAVLGTATLGAGTAGLTSLISWNPYNPLNPDTSLSNDNYNYGVAVGDFNGDGIPDLVMTNYGNNASLSNTLTVLLGNGDGTFTASAANPKTGGCGVAVAVGDFNGDGIPDLAVLCGGGVTIFLGNGDGTFTPAPSLKAGNYPMSIAAADFNGDGNLDLAVANYYDSTVTIFLGNGDGTFTAAPASPATGEAPMAIVAGDFNGDGIPDLAVANSEVSLYEGTVTILLGNGDGTFTAAASPIAVSDATCIAVGDFNRDGIEDLAVGNNVLLGNGDGTFNVVASWPASGYPATIAVGDFNGDGIPDLALAFWNSGTVMILLGKGDGTLTVGVAGPMEAYANAIAVGDFKGDGTPDLAVTAESGNTVLLTESQTAMTMATAVAILPASSGTHQVVASYSGDSNYKPSTSGTTGLNAAQSTSSVNVTTSANPAIYGISVTFTATVSGGGLTPTGTVSYFDGSNPLCTATLNGGVAACAANTLTLGSNSITAQYAGDNNYTAATSVTFNLSVSPAAPTFSVAAGTYYAPQMVTISDSSPGAIIYYTTDGTQPTTSSTMYSGPITISSSEMIEAMAMASNYSQSVIATAGYFITPLAVGGTFDWTWMGGSSTVPTTSDGSGGQSGVYGTLGTPAAGNIPGSRQLASTWTDSSGNLWLFGGTGFDVSGTWGTLDDLWEFNPSTNLWTWMGGSNTPNQPGVYGTLGVPAAGNIPGSRQGAASWTDNRGNFWLFGGTPGTATGFLNDLWEFNPSTNLWAWMGGGDGSTMQCANNGYGLSVCGQPGVYGTLSVPTAGNVPRGRQWATSWTDSSGDLWLFGGWGMAANGNWSGLNDLWKFTSSTNQWTWMGGSNTDAGNCFITDIQAPNGSLCGPSGVYGALGTPAAGNVPGGRYGITSWSDASGNLWLFGGSGFDANGNSGYLNDLWEFNSSTNLWSWMDGSSTEGSNGIPAGQPGVYGTLGTPAAGNVPGARQFGSGWADNSGNFWLFGGYGADANGPGGYLNDLWEFNPTSNQWAWMGGSSTWGSNCIQANGDTLCGQAGVFGTLGVPAAGNIPGGLDYCTASWTDSNGNFWLFGGWGYDANGNLGYLNDLWKYQPATALLAAATPTFSVTAGTYAATQTVTISDTTANATIYYTTNGTTPTTSSTVYSAPITVSSSETLEAIATANGYSQSAVATAAYTISSLPQAATPAISLAAGSYNAAQTVTISDTTPGATIHYTTNGTMPTTSSTVYSTPITVSSSETLEAIATANGYSQSAVATAAYTINVPQAATPAISLAAGSYNAAQTVTISDTTPGATIHYTTDGTTPTTSSTVYSGPITVSSTETIEAIATATGYSTSAVATAAYTINLPQAATPTISVAAGSYTAAQTVTISDTTPGAIIYYTTDGTTPTMNSSVYSGAITVSSTETIEAMATASGYSTSAVATAAYTISNLPQAATPTFSVAAGSYTAAQTVILSDATAAAIIYYTSDGSTPTTASTVYNGPITVSSTETIEAIATASGYLNSTAATAAYTINISTNPAPFIGSMTPAYTSAGGAAFTLTVNGLQFTQSSTVYWGTTALATTYVSATQLTAQVTAADIANGDIAFAITVQTPTPGGGTSDALTFQVDSAASTATPPAFTSTTAIVASGSPASYPVSLPSTVTTTTVSCLNLPPGATCSYSSTTNTVTITTSAATPVGTYQVTVVFNETVSGASTSWILLPILLLPLVFLRRRMAARGAWVTACLGLVLLAGAALCSSCGGGGGGGGNSGGGSGGGGGGGAQTHQVTSSGVVTLTVK